MEKSFMAVFIIVVAFAVVAAIFFAWKHERALAPAVESGARTLQNGASDAAQEQAFSASTSPDDSAGGSLQKLPDGLEYQDEVVGAGAAAVAGQTVTVHYVGTLTNGQKFDSSLDRGEPFTFALGAGQVIRGWDEGVAGMKVGGKRKLIIPPSLGYGSQAIGPIPANSTLVFEVQLLSVGN